MGLNFGETAQVLFCLGVPVTAGALSSGAQSTGTDFVPAQDAIVDRIKSAPMVVTGTPKGVKEILLSALDLSKGKYRAVISILASHRRGLVTS